jgi:dTDP-4-dehydrorhamnose reductase
MTMPQLPNRIAVTGAAGQLGSEMIRMLGTRGVALPRSAIDITSADAVNETLERLRPDVLVNAAAWTAVDAAEANPQACEAVNARGVAILAAACERVRCRLVQVSTDYVFGADRQRSVPYAEEEEPGPVNAYGSSKLRGEHAARGCPHHLIVRTCGLYSVSAAGPLRGRNFLDTMLVLSGQQSEVAIVADQRCTPSYVPDVACGLLSLIAAEATGTFHVTSRGSVSWYELAKELFRQAGRPTSVRAIASHEYAAPAVRPSYSVLDTAKFERVTGLQLPTWQEAVAAYLESNRERMSCSRSS